MAMHTYILHRLWGMFPRCLSVCRGGGQKWLWSEKREQDILSTLNPPVSLPVYTAPGCCYLFSWGVRGGVTLKVQSNFKNILEYPTH